MLTSAIVTPIASVQGGQLVGVMTELAQSYIFWAVIGSTFIQLGLTIFGSYKKRHDTTEATVAKVLEILQQQQADIRVIKATMPDPVMIKDELRQEFRFMLEKVAQQSRKS